MDGKSIAIVAADFAVGGITASAIQESYGEGVLGAVLALAGGSIAGLATNAALSVVDRETGIVSDVGGLIDDVFSIFD